MSYGRTYQPQGGTLHEYQWPSFPRNHDNNNLFQNDDYYNYNRYNHYDSRMFDDAKRHDYYYNALGNCRERALRENYSGPNGSPSFKRRKISENTWRNDGDFYYQTNLNRLTAFIPSNDFTVFPTVAATSTSAQCNTVGKRERSDMEDKDCAVLMSREEIERCSPSRKDGIDSVHETRLRYSYCAFIQNLGMRLDMPQTTIGTAMVLCHRFFIRRSHACHDRFLIATATLFLAAKSEETARPLNDVLKASYEILHKQDLSILSYMLPIDWFEQYRERIIEAEQLILTTLNFELTVQHPFDTLTSILNKLGVSQTQLMNLALNLVSEGGLSDGDGLLFCEDAKLSLLHTMYPYAPPSRFRSSLWLQFKPHQIAAGVAYLAAKMLNMNFDSVSIWREFQTPPTVLQDVAQQLMELFQD